MQKYKKLSERAPFFNIKNGGKDSKMPLPPSWRILLFRNRNHLAGAVCAHLGSLLALDGSHAARERAWSGCEHVVGNHVYALVQMVKEQVGSTVARLAVVAHTLLIAVAAGLINRLEARGSFVSEHHIVHRLLAGDDKAHSHLVPHLQRMACGLLASIEGDKLLADAHLLDTHFLDVLHWQGVLPVDTTPSRTVSATLDGEQAARFGIDIATAVTDETVEAVQFHGLPVNADCWRVSTLNPLAASRQQSLHSIGCQT